MTGEPAMTAPLGHDRIRNVVRYVAGAAIATAVVGAGVWGWSVWRPNPTVVPEVVEFSALSAIRDHVRG